jgi:hypothetical protein
LRLRIDASFSRSYRDGGPSREGSFRVTGGVCLTSRFVGLPVERSEPSNRYPLFQQRGDNSPAIDIPDGPSAQIHPRIHPFLDRMACACLLQCAPSAVAA